MEPSRSLHAPGLLSPSHAASSSRPSTVADESIASTASSTASSTAAVYRSPTTSPVGGQDLTTLSNNFHSLSVDSLALSKTINALRSFATGPGASPFKSGGTDDGSHRLSSATDPLPHVKVIQLPFNRQIFPLSEQEVLEAREKYGRNCLVQSQTRSSFSIAWASFFEPFNVLLTCSAALSLLLDEQNTAIIMFCMVLISGGIRCVQEIRSERQLHSLLGVLNRRTTLIRQRPVSASSLSVKGSVMGALDQKRYSYNRLPLEEVVPGDFVQLKAGDSVPADVQVISCNRLQIDQSLLTGESAPISKRPEVKTTPEGAEKVEITFAEHHNREQKQKSKQAAGRPICCRRLTSCLICSACCFRLPSILMQWLCDCLPVLEPEALSSQKLLQQKQQQAQENAYLKHRDICLLGTNVVSGDGVGVVLGTGADTYFGQLAQHMQGRKPPSAFERCIRRVSWLFVVNMLIVLPPVLITRGFGLSVVTDVDTRDRRTRWFETGQYALSVAVGLTPEMLPMILNANLARGSILFGRQSRCIVKRIECVVNLGCMNILCTDKTGTLTEQFVHLEQCIRTHGQTCSLTGQLAYLNARFHDSYVNLIDRAIRQKYEGSTANLAGPASSVVATTTSSGSGGGHNDVDEPERSKASKQQEIQRKVLRTTGLQVHKVDEVPFDFERRRVSVVLRLSEPEVHLLIAKGAVAEMMSICERALVGPMWCENVDNFQQINRFCAALLQHQTHIQQHQRLSVSAEEGSLFPLMDDQMKQELVAYSEQLSAQGYIVLALGCAVRQAKTDLGHKYSCADETRLCLIGFLCFTNPPKKSAHAAIQSLYGQQVEVKVLSGDGLQVCQNVCSKLGIPIKHVISGSQLQRLMSGPTSKEEQDGLSIEDRLAFICRRTSVFAQLTPSQKCAIVRSLKRQGQVVGFLGDGINDALALKESDVGISVDSGTEIAKDAADIVMLQKELSVIKEGITHGRRAHSNTSKYVYTSVASNFGNVLSILFASVWLPFLPMASNHILLLNLLYDIGQLTVPWDRVDAISIRSPPRFVIRHLFIFMLCVGGLSTVFDVGSFIYMLQINGLECANNGTCFERVAAATDATNNASLMPFIMRRTTKPTTTTRKTSTLSPRAWTENSDGDNFMIIDFKNEGNDSIETEPATNNTTPTTPATLRTTATTKKAFVSPSPPSPSPPSPSPLSPSPPSPSPPSPSPPSPSSLSTLTPPLINFKQKAVKEFQTGWFTVGLVTQTLVYHLNRTRLMPFCQSNASIPVYLSTGLALLVGMIIPHVHWLADLFEMKVPASDFYLFLLVLITGYCLTNQLFKMTYVLYCRRWID